MPDPTHAHDDAPGLSPVTPGPGGATAIDGDSALTAVAPLTALTALMQLAEGVIMTDANGRITFVNDAARRMHGVALLDVAPESYADRYHLLTEEGEPYPPAELPLARAVQRGETVLESRWRIRRPDGSVVHAIGSAHPIRSDGGVQVGAVLTLRDDTPRADADAARRDSDARARFLAESVPVLVWMAAVDGTLDYVSEQAAAYVGRAPDELLHAGWSAVTHPDDRGGANRRWAASVAAGERYEAEVRIWSAAHGEYRWHLAQAVARRAGDGRIVGWVGSNTDIEEWKRAQVAAERAHEAAAAEAAANIVLAHRLREQAVELEHQVEEAQAHAEEAELATQRAQEAATEAEEARDQAEESERRFRATADAAPVLIWTAGLDGGCDWFNQPWLDFTGQTTSQGLGDGWMASVHPDDLARCGETYHTAFAARASFAMDYRLRRHDGVYRWILDTGVPRFDGRGEFVGFIGSCLDVTDRKRAEQDRALLAHASAAFVGSLDVDATLERVAGIAVPVLADYCSVDLVDEQGEIRRVASSHVDPARVELVRETWRRYPYRTTDRVGVPEVLRTRTPMLISRVPDEGFRAFVRDDEHEALLRALGPRSFLCVPLLARDRTIGALSLVYAESGREYDEHDLGVGMELARRVATAIDNAQLFRAAETAARRSTLLAEVSAQLSTSLDIETTLGSIAGLVVPALADWCAIDLVDETGDAAAGANADADAPIDSRRIAVAHQDPEKVRWADELRRRYPPDPRARTGVPDVLRTGRSTFHPEISDTLLAAAAIDEEHLRILRQVGFRSAMIVPMIGRGRVVGAISFVASETVPPYTAEDLALAEEFGRRAGTAVDNARLHAAAVSAQAHAERSADRTARLQGVTAALAESVIADHVADVVLAQGLAVTGAFGGVLALVSADGTGLDVVRATGYDRDLVAPHQRLPFDADVPLAVAARSGEPCWLPSRAAYDARFPHLAPSVERTGTQALAAVPLVVEHRTLGAIGLSFDHPNALEEPDRAFIMALAGQAAQAIDRARLFDAERAARQAANEARAAAELANAAKSDFLATMSHELRTPINAILGYTELVVLGLSGPLTDEQRHQLDRIRGSTQHLLSLVNEVLDLAHVESGTLRVGRFAAAVHQTVDAALAHVRPQAAAKRLTIEADEGGADELLYLGDEARVRQILINLLSNAVKFTRPDGCVHVTWTPDDRPPAAAGVAGDRWVAIRVSDTGVGIPAEQLARIFEPFTQAVSGGRTRYAREAEGTGLGLTISQRLARLMDGALTVESVPGVGSTFTLWLPAAAPRAAADGAEAGRVRQPGDAEQPDGAPGAPDDGIALPDQPGDDAASPGLARIGAAVIADVAPIVARWVEQLRADEALVHAAGASDAELEDHAATFVTDIGLALRVFAAAGQEPAELLRDGTAILTLIAERHGAQRARLGWSEAAVARSLTLLGGLLHAAVDRASEGEATDTRARAHVVVAQLTEQAQRVSLGGYRMASPSARK